MDKTYPEAHRRLELWGNWAHEVTNLGYPKMSLEQMAADGNGINTRGSGLKVIPECPVPEVDVILTELKKQKPTIYTAISNYYQLKSVTIRGLNRRTGVGRARIKNMLLIGCEFVNQRL